MTNAAERINSDETIPRKIFMHCTYGKNGFVKNLNVDVNAAKSFNKVVASGISLNLLLYNYFDDLNKIMFSNFYLVKFLDILTKPFLCIQRIYCYLHHTKSLRFANHEWL